MKKRRTTVYVRPGKDVTLYVPADTSPLVIDYLNRLKEEGEFSQGVMEILTRYVHREQTMAELALPMQGHMDESVSMRGSENMIAASHAETGEKKLSLSDIFRQARRNSGKMTHFPNNNE